MKDAIDQDAPVFQEDQPPARLSRRAEAKRMAKGRHTPRAERQRPGVWTALILLSSAVIVVMLLSVVSGLTRENAFRRLMAEDQAETLAPGVSIDGIAVGGYSREKAKALLSAPSEPTGAAFEYRIRLNDRVWLMTQDNLPVGSDRDAQLNRAWSVSRRLSLSPGETVDSPFAARARLRACIREEGQTLSSVTGYEWADIARYVDGLAEAVDRRPVSAALIGVDFTRRDFMFSEDIPGMTLDRDALAGEIARRLSAGETSAEFDAPVDIVPAAVTRLRLKNTFGCLEMRSFETETPEGDAQAQGYAKALNGLMFAPGETVGLRGLIGNGEASETADRFATAMFSAGVCAGLTLVERAPLETALPEARGLEAHLDSDHDLRLKNTAETPLCALCYYTPLNGRGTRGSVTLEIYGVMRQGGETAELQAEITETLPAGAPEYRINGDLEPGTTLLRREARDGASVNTLLVHKMNGKVFRTETVCSATYPPVSRLIEKAP